MTQLPPGSTTEDPNAKTGQLNLLDLPSDVLDLILTPALGFLTAPAVINLAYTCKLAASLVLPRVYSAAPLLSLRTLSTLHATVSTRPDLAAHVRGVVAGGDLVFMAQQLDRMSHALDHAKLTSGSALASVEAALARCGPQALQAMPMLWLARIAAVCPNLVCVDLANVSPAYCPPSFMFGLLNLTNVLRARRGRCISPGRALSLAVVLVHEPANALDDMLDLHRLRPILAHVPHKVPYGVRAIDWARKELTVGNTAKDLAVDMFTVPLCDLISMDRNEQASWRIVNVTSCSVDHFDAGHALRPSLARTKEEAWTAFGVRVDEDHVFTLDRRSLRVVDVLTHSLAGIRAWTTSHGMDAAKACKSVSIRGFAVGRGHMAEKSVFSMIADIHRLPSHPWVGLTSLTFSTGLIFNLRNVGPLFSSLAAGLPNLIDLSIVNMAVTLDVCLHSLDVLIRRPSNPLLSLSITCGHDPRILVMMGAISTRSAPALFSDPDPHRTPLAQNRSAAGHLHSLSLSFVGNTAEDDRSQTIPTVLIHPGLMHGIHKLTLSDVHLAISPPALSHPTSPSFLPTSALEHLHPRTFRAPLHLGHTALSKLVRLELTNASLSTPLSNPAPRLPHAPNLASFDYADTPMVPALSARAIVDMLAKYPSVRTAHFSKAQMSRTDVQETLLALLFPPLAWVPELRPCPHLRQLGVHNLARGADQTMAGHLVLGPHVLDGMMAADTPVDVACVPSSAEAEYALRVRKGEHPCRTCGLLAPRFAVETDMEMTGEARGRMLHLGSLIARGRAVPMARVSAVAPELRCVRCGHEKVVRMFAGERDGAEAHDDAGAGQERMCMWLKPSYVA